MRTVALLVLAALLSVASTAQADVVIDLSSDGPYARAEQLRQREQHALVLRDVGIAFTLLGVVSTIAGAVTAVKYFGDPFADDGRPDSYNGTLFKTGVGLFAAGQVAATAGIAMWATGGANASNASRDRISFGATGLSVKF